MRISFIAILAASCAGVGDAFTYRLPAVRNLASTRSMTMSSEVGSEKSLVVISPPGGVGECTAVKAASMGSSVRWFVVSDSSNSQKVALSQELLASIAAAGGKVELAGADTESLLLPVEEAQSAIGAVSQWCGTADCLVCTFDGVEKAIRKKDSKEDPVQNYMDSIKLAAREAVRSVRGRKIAILPADADDDDEKSNDGGLLGSLLGGRKVEIPASLDGAMAMDAAKVVKIRYGDLFGVPESSPDFSPLVGGPRRDPVLCEEYSMRSIRVDPTLSVSSIALKKNKMRSSRHAIGEAAARVALGAVSVADGLDVFLASQNGREELSGEVWNEEFARVEKMLSSGEGAQLFEASFSSVPDVERLADWLATKWAPAVLRSYDIAGIRIGARPVYANRAGDGRTEIVWQQLDDNMQTATIGRMIITVSDNGIVATRGPGDASKGFGSISRKPLNGEDVLVSTLADAASQAVEKGLAKKVAKVKQTKSKKKAEPVAPVSTVVSSGDIKPKAPSTDAGPRVAGARRSTQRARGARTRKSAPGGDEKGDSESFQ